MSIASEITRINTNIANAYDAIEDKGGTLPQTQNSNNLATAISSIPSGGTLQSKSVTITQNGQTTVAPDTGYDGLSSVSLTTNVKDELNSLIDGSITSIDSDVTSIRARGFYGCNHLTSANFPETTSVGANGFDGCNNLDDLSMPKLTSIGASGFANCRSLTEINFPSLSGVGSSTFSNCNSLEVADMGNLSQILASSFSNCYTLEALILRRNSVVTLLNVNAFNNCNILNGGIYVPRDLIESYKIATNWSTIYDEEIEDFFRPIEGSEYEL